MAQFVDLRTKNGKLVAKYCPDLQILFWRGGGEEALFYLGDLRRKAEEQQSERKQDEAKRA